MLLQHEEVASTWWSIIRELVHGLLSICGILLVYLVLMLFWVEKDTYFRTRLTYVLYHVITYSAMFLLIVYKDVVRCIQSITSRTIKEFIKSVVVFTIIVGVCVMIHFVFFLENGGVNDVV